MIQSVTSRRSGTSRPSRSRRGALTRRSIETRISLIKNRRTGTVSRLDTAEQTFQAHLRFLKMLIEAGNG